MPLPPGSINKQDVQVAAAVEEIQKQLWLHAVPHAGQCTPPGYQMHNIKVGSRARVMRCLAACRTADYGSGLPSQGVPAWQPRQ